MTLAAVGDKIANYEYDYAGLRTAKIVDGKRTSFINNGGKVIAELSEGQLTNYYRGLTLIGFENNDEYYYYKLNAHGDTIGILDSFGQQVKEYLYDAFGNEQTPDKFDTNPFRYCGEYYDNETGLIYLRARYYDSNTQRFISEDPIRDGFNWYAYCGNNPVIYRDSTGMWQEGDEKFSSSMQVELLKLTYAWYLAETKEEKDDIHKRADNLRTFFSKGTGKFVDKGKTITGAAADEFSWLLGGDVDKAERDYWLKQVSDFQNVRISEDQVLKSVMFALSIGLPSADDVWNLISKKASKEMLETVGEKGAKKFIKALTKYAGKHGESGIKNLGKNGIKYANKVYHYEVKIMGKGGAYRLLGNLDESGNLIFTVFDKLHK